MRLQQTYLRIKIGWVQLIPTEYHANQVVLGEAQLVRINE